MKKGRHRRFEEARALKRITLEPSATPCDECGAAADAKCASWCLARVPEDDVEVGIEGEFDEELDREFPAHPPSEFHHAPNEAANY